jgi:hypothetical protein
MSQVRTFLAGCTTMAAALAALTLLTAAKEGPVHGRLDASGKVVKTVGIIE